MLQVEVFKQCISNPSYDRISIKDIKYDENYKYHIFIKGISNSVWHILITDNIKQFYDFNIQNEYKFSDSYEELYIDHDTLIGLLSGLSQKYDGKELVLSFINILKMFLKEV